MVDLQLDSNEEILLQAKRVWRYEEDENQFLKNLYLSNKNLICVHEETKGFFSKTETIVDKISLRDIRIVDGIVQVEKVDDDDYEETLQILYRNGKRELYGLDEDDDEDIDMEYKRWESAISKAVTEYFEHGEFMAPISDKSANRNELADSQMPKPEGQSIPKGTAQEKEVVFCFNCDAPNSVTAKYCQDCGAPMGMVLQAVNEPRQNAKVQVEKGKGGVEADNEQYIRSTYSERKQEYAGKIYKCPACGQELSSTDAICPSCGHEMNEVRTHPILERFISELNECDFNIEQEEMDFDSGAVKGKSGWSSWKMSVKILWIVLNCLTLCAPLVLYYVVIKNKRNATPNTNIKQSLIENFQIPNERQAIIAVLNFIRGKVIALSSQKIRKETWHSIKLWSAKARQIHKQAVELLSNDAIVENIYRDIVLETRKAKKVFEIKVVLIFFLVVVYILIICCFDTFLFRQISHEEFEAPYALEQMDEKEPVKWSDMFLSDYFPEPVLTNAYVYSNSKEECNIGQINCAQSEYYAYCRQCKERGFDYEIVEEDDTWFTAYNSEGYKVHVSYIGSDLSVELSAPLKMSDFNWPESEIGKIIPVPQSTYGKISWEYDSGFLIYIGNMGHEDFSEYATLLYESGFNINDRKDDNYFWADNADGYHISIEYKGFNIVWLRADAPDDK